MKTLLYLVIGLMSLVVNGQQNDSSNVRLKTIYRSTILKKPHSNFFIIKGDIAEFENFVTLANALKNEFKKTGIRVHTDFDFSDSETKVLDKDIMVVNPIGVDRKSFEMEMLLDFTSLKREKSLHFAMKNKENELLLRGYFEFLKNDITPETTLSISKSILALFE